MFGHKNQERQLKKGKLFLFAQDKFFFMSDQSTLLFSNFLTLISNKTVEQLPQKPGVTLILSTFFP